MKSLKLAVIGTGYVGLVSGTCFAEVGHRVICVDRDSTKIEMLRQGKIPIHEPGLAELVAKNTGSRLSFTTRFSEAVMQSEIVMIAVGTPSSEDGSADLTAVWGVLHEVAQCIDGPQVVVVKSTVPVGTCDKLERRLAELRGRNAPFIPVVSNPEFLREGRAVNDFMRGDRVVVGASDDEAAEVTAALYEPLGLPVVFCDRRSSEMIKYASNAFLATKISFINSMARLCDELGADVAKVAEGMGYDHRIMPEHLRAGLGYGGSCFPKDVKALLRMGLESGVDLKVLEAARQINDSQPEWAVEKLKEILGTLKGKSICLWGIAFKADTDDTREAPALRLLDLLVREGARVTAYDPVATVEETSCLLIAGDPYEAVTGCHAVILVTEWAEFLNISWERVYSLMERPVVIDGRNFLNPKMLIQNGFAYRDMGRSGAVIPLERQPWEQSRMEAASGDPGIHGGGKR